MGAAIQMRAVTVVTVGDRRALPGQVFSTNAEHAARLLREGAAVVVDERDLEKLAGREADMRRTTHRRVRGYIGRP